MTRRNPAAVVILTLLTFTLYAYYWLYRTTDELRQASGKRELRPFLDLVLAAVTAGLWGWWAAYRNARIVHALQSERGVPHTDRSLPIAACALLSFVTGGGWLVGMALLQDDLNGLAAEPDRWAPAAPYAQTSVRPIQVRVEVEDERAHAELPHGEAFASKAPAPFAF